MKIKIMAWSLQYLFLEYDFSKQDILCFVNLNFEFYRFVD